MIGAIMAVLEPRKGIAKTEQLADQGLEVLNEIGYPSPLQLLLRMIIYHLRDTVDRDSEALVLTASDLLLPGQRPTRSEASALWA